MLEDGQALPPESKPNIWVTWKCTAVDDARCEHLHVKHFFFLILFFIVIPFNLFIYLFIMILDNFLLECILKEKQ